MASPGKDRTRNFIHDTTVGFALRHRLRTVYGLTLPCTVPMFEVGLTLDLHTHGVGCQFDSFEYNTANFKKLQRNVEQLRLHNMSVHYHDVLMANRRDVIWSKRLDKPVTMLKADERQHVPFDMTWLDLTCNPWLSVAEAMVDIVKGNQRPQLMFVTVSTWRHGKNLSYSPQDMEHDFETMTTAAGFSHAKLCAIGYKGGDGGHGMPMRMTGYEVQPCPK